MIADFFTLPLPLLKPCYRCRSTNVQLHNGTWLDEDTTYDIGEVICGLCGATSPRYMRECGGYDHDHNPDPVDLAVQDWERLWSARRRATVEEALECPEVRAVLDWVQHNIDQQNKEELTKMLAPFSLPTCARGSNPMWAETVEVIHRTDKAVRISYETVEVWIPFSQILDDSEIYETCQIGDEGLLCLPEWLAEQKGLML